MNQGGRRGGVAMYAALYFVPRGDPFSMTTRTIQSIDKRNGLSEVMMISNILRSERCEVVHP